MLLPVDEPPVFLSLDQYAATAASPAAPATSYNGRMLGPLAGAAYILEIDENAPPHTPLYPPSEQYAGISAYDPDGMLVSRSQPGAVHHEADIVASQALRLAKGEALIASDGSALVLRADSLCVHGDNAGSVAAVQRIRQTLQSLAG